MVTPTQTTSWRRSQRSHALLCAGLLALAAGGGCAPLGGDETALDLALVPDLNLNTQEQLATKISRVEVVVDSDDGLYDADEAQQGDGFEIANCDGDPALELRFTAEVPGGRLPRLRLERGGLPEAALDIRARGYFGDEPEPRAAGGVSGARFSDGEVGELPIPFNLLPSFLPPRVTEVFPADGQQLYDCDLGLVVVVFSKAIDPATLIPNQTVVHEGSALSSFQLTLGRIAQFVVQSESIGTGTIRVGIGVTDTEGLSLDQRPAEAGPQPFTSAYIGPDHCNVLGTQWCGEPPQPPLYEEGACPDIGLARLECQDGICVPAGCGDAGCGDGFVCDEASGGCEIDCRLYGGQAVCSDERPICDPDTGSCRAAA